MAVATSSTSAPVASHRALMELMLLIRWARKAFAVFKEKEALSHREQQHHLAVLSFNELMLLTEKGRIGFLKNCDCNMPSMFSGIWLKL